MPIGSLSRPIDPTSKTPRWRECLRERARNAGLAPDAGTRTSTRLYLHDSQKGYTHGCVEVAPNFFIRLRQLAADLAKKKGANSWLVLKVKYPSKSEGANGGAKVGP